MHTNMITARHLIKLSQPQLSNAAFDYSKSVEKRSDAWSIFDAVWQSAIPSLIELIKGLLSQTPIWHHINTKKPPSEHLSGAKLTPFEHQYNAMG